MLFAGMLSAYCSTAAASIAETMALRESVQNLKVIFIGFFLLLFLLGLPNLRAQTPSCLRQVEAAGATVQLL